jgi:hypothetical protein
MHSIFTLLRERPLMPHRRYFATKNEKRKNSVIKFLFVVNSRSPYIYFILVTDFSLSLTYSRTHCDSRNKD